MATTLNRHLTTLDAGFLYSERTDQQLTFGCLADPTPVPDIWFFADCLKESFVELLAAAEQQAPPGTVAPVSVTRQPARKRRGETAATR